MKTESKRKVDDDTLYHLLVEEGRNQQEAAVHFGVSEAAISKRVKALNINLTRHVGLERAKTVADHGLNIVEQLQTVNDVIQTEMNWAIDEARKPGGDRKGLQQVVIDLTSEIRKQLRFQLEILRSLYDMRGVAEFQKEVLDAIGEIAPDTRQAIIRRLVEKRALRSALSLPEPGR